MRCRPIILVVAAVFASSCLISPAQGQFVPRDKKKVTSGKAKARNAKFGWAIKKGKRIPGQPAKRVFGCETRRNDPKPGDTMRRCPGPMGATGFP
jgi:hypothetical protein